MKEQNNNKFFWNEEKKHTFFEIKQFYEKIALFDQEVLNQIIFYGGTIIYIDAQSDIVDRCFGDLDILVPAKKIDLVRDYLEKTGSLNIQYDGKKIAEDYNIVSQDGIQDFGFKGILFGVKLSLHPIHETEDGEIITKWIKIDDNKVDLIANCTMLLNSNLKEILTKIKLGSSTLNIVKPELNLGWKKRRMDWHDEQDIKFMYENKEKLRIKQKNIEKFIAKMPSYDVSIAYKITPNGIKELGKGKYEDF